MNPTPFVIACQHADSPPSDQCNCACSASISVRGCDEITDSRSDLRLHPQLRFHDLDGAHRVVFVPSGERSLAVLNEASSELLFAFHQQRRCDVPIQWWYEQWGESIVNRILGQFIELGFLRPSMNQPWHVAEQNHVLETWLHITDQCNLRCAYCFLPHRSVNMPLKTGLAAIEATFRSARIHQYSRVKLKYAGGEPLLRFPLIVELHKHAQRLSEHHGLILDAVVLSNGTCLTSEIIKTMQALDMRLMVSLDGLGEVHDHQRPYASGKGSFEDAARSVELAQSSGLLPHISITVCGRNADGFSEVIEWVLQRGLPFSVNFYRENDRSATFEDLRLNHCRIMSGMRKALTVLETHLPCQSLLASFVDLANLSFPHLRACGVGQSYLVYDQNGQLCKCQVQLDRPVATVEANDPLALIRDDTLGVMNLSVNEKEVCRDCEWRYWCAGGCPLATYRNTGRYDTRSPYCDIYKSLFPEIVRLEGLRLLKWFNPETTQSYS